MLCAYPLIRYRAWEAGYDTGKPCADAMGEMAETRISVEQFVREAGGASRYRRARTVLRTRQSIRSSQGERRGVRRWKGSGGTL